MAPINRRLLLDSALVGVLLTLVVLLVQWAGWLERLEWWFYDQRAAYCQIFRPAPTDRLAHLDIDNGTLNVVGRWPWPRARLAEIIDELNVAGPKAIALDVIFPDEQKKVDNNGVDHDALLAAAIQRTGCTLVPCTVPFTRESASPLQQAVYEQLLGDLELSPDQVAERIKPRWHDADLAAQVEQVFAAARSAAVFERLKKEMLAGNHPVAQLRKRLLPRTGSGLETPLLELFYEQHKRVEAALALERFTRPVPPGLSPPPFHSDVDLAPIKVLSDAAAATGFVDNPVYPDGKVRSIPLFVEADGRMFGQMGFVLACMTLDVDLKDLRFTRDEVIVPRPGGKDIVVPVREFRSGTLGQRVPMFMDIPWFGKGDWESMYDPAHPASRKNHLPVNAVWDACLTRRAIAGNNAKADEAMRALAELFSPDKLPALAAMTLPPDDALSRMKPAQDTLSDVEALVEPSRQIEPRQRSENEQRAVASVDALRDVLRENPALKTQLDTRRAQLKAALGGKAVLIGSTATGASDFVPTSLHAKCPGVVLHGAIFNGVMTGETWRFLPDWMTTLLTLLLGLLTTAAVVWLPPSRALLVALLLAGGYALVNGFLLFDYGNRVLGVAGPLLAVAAVWQGGTLIRLLVERWERARIEDRFRSYVDPALVDYVVDHLGEVKLEGQIRELTVVFTDLTGFTSLAGQLGERCVPLLNEFMGEMVPVIRKHKGYRNKFLGDGIMFFFGAPREDAQHARNAVASVLEMQTVLIEFNRSLLQRGLPELGLRAGVSTGNMVVGDAGSKGASDYTVLGDYVNLGARLESANKSMGTNCLLTGRTIELAGDGFLFRPIGKLCVVGRSEGVMTYEGLGWKDSATDEQKQLAELTEQIVSCYLRAKLRECLEGIDRMETVFGPGKLTKLYRELCEEHLRRPSLDDFDCQIVLTEK